MARQVSAVPELADAAREPVDGCSMHLFLSCAANAVALVTALDRVARGMRGLTIEHRAPNEMEELVDGDTVPDAVLEEWFAGSTSVVVQHTTEDEIWKALARHLAAGGHSDVEQLERD
jgi:hypothetical protein